MASDSILSPEALRSAHASEEAYVKAVGAVNYFLPAGAGCVDAVRGVKSPWGY